MTTAAAIGPLVADRLRGWSDEIRELVAIPSETGSPHELARAASWIADRAAALGCEVKTFRQDAHAPLVVAEIGDGPRTLVSPQHYDVQPAGARELWSEDPFSAAEKDGRLWGRGVVDNKGHLLLRLLTLAAMRDATGTVPARVRFLIEGEEESGSEHLVRLLAARPELTAGDAAMNEGGQVTADGTAVVTCGVRGMLYVELTASTLAQDVHSMYASIAPSAAWRLVEALGTLRRSEGTVTIDGFYDDVRVPTPEHVAFTNGIAFDAAAVRRQLGADRFVGGVDGLAAQRAQLFRPTCNIDGVLSGWPGPGTKTIVPAQARAFLDMRLVPDQDPDRIAAALRAHLDARGFEDIAIRIHAAERAYWSSVDAPVVGIAVEAARHFGAPAVRVISGPGTAPMYPVCAPHRLPSVSLGITHPDARLHAPNENLRLDLMRPYALAYASFVERFGALPG